MSNELNKLARYARLKGNSKTVLIVLCDMADNESFKAWPSIKTLALYCGISERTVIRAIKRLVQIRMVKKQKKISFNGSYCSNIYTINKDMLKLYSSDECQIDRRGTVTLTPKAPSIQSSLKKLEFPKESLKQELLEKQRIRNEYMKEEKRKLFAFLRALDRQSKKNRKK